jgi:hypothetical protein
VWRIFADSAITRMNLPMTGPRLEIFERSVTI